ALLRSGRTAGVFQFESPLATDCLRNMRCDRFDDLVAANALLRPGPLDTGMHLVFINRKLGRDRVTYPHPALEEVLKPTYGVITDKVVEYINEARELGLDVLPPDVNESGFKFTVVADTRIRFGLGGIKNVGEGAIASILAGRVAAGPYRSLVDLCDRVDLRLCNKRVFESLIDAGACDSLGG